MKTALAVVLAVVGTAICFSLLPRSTAAPVPGSSVGRYTITHTYENRAFMLDTETGNVWEYTHADYCQGKANPLIRQTGIGDQCRDDEDALSNITQFQRVTVDGLYKTPMQGMIDASFQGQFQRESRRMKAEPKGQ